VANFGSEHDLAVRARALRGATLEAVCDVVRPWSDGVVARATPYPHYYEYNVVRVTGRPTMGVDELKAFADDALAGLGHRRVDFDLIDAAAPLRPAFEASGWRTLRLLVMHHDGRPPAAPEIRVVEVPYEAVRELRKAWLAEDFPDSVSDSFFDQAREVAEMLGARVLAVHEQGTPVAFAQIEFVGTGAEISEVYVRADHRGRGLGTAITLAAIHHAQEATDIWIGADDEDRPKRLYARLGFRPVTTMMQFTRVYPFPPTPN
jgi:GNAT superfamily N-acetyltransferase